MLPEILEIHSDHDAISRSVLQDLPELSMVVNLQQIGIERTLAEQLGRFRKA